MVSSPHDLWRDLCEKDDRTSPEDYPDMALITEDELVSMLQQYGDARDAEIDRLRELFRLDGEQHASALQYARHEQDTRLAAYSAEIARLRAPPGADVIELARRMIENATRKRPGWTSPYLDIDIIARSLQQYGDERAAAAIEEARGTIMKHELHIGICDQSAHGCVSAILYELHVLKP